MKFISAVAFALCAVVLLSSASAAPPGEAQIVRQESDVGPENFQFAWETSDGQAANAEGHLNNAGTENEAISVKGSYRFIGDDGVTYEVTYIADENGFQPQGAHLPVA